MRGRTSVMLLAVAALTVACTSSTETPSAPRTSTTTPAVTDTGATVVTPLLASVIAAPIPVPATDGKVHLAYELQLTNVLDQELTLTSVDVRARRSDSVEPDRRPARLLDACPRKPSRHNETRARTIRGGVA